MRSEKFAEIVLALGPPSWLFRGFSAYLSYFGFTYGSKFQARLADAEKSAEFLTKILNLI